MSLIKFEAELDDNQFDKFTDFMVWLKNDKNFKSGIDVINKNKTDEKNYVEAIENCYGDRQEITKGNQYQVFAIHNENISVINDWSFMATYPLRYFGK